ncbi:hypothetical protein [Geodermatophilus sp. URMC 64]
MTGHRRLARAATVALLALPACTAPDPPAAEPAPATAAPPPTTRPRSADGGPQLVLRAAVDLSPALPGRPAEVVSAVAAPDGGAHVVLQPADGTDPVLATVEGGGALVRAVPVPRLAQVFGVHLLPTGEVLVAGQFPRPGRDYGFAAVDPATGAARTAVVVPYEEGTAFTFGRSALSADGAALYLFVATAVDDRNLDLLVAVDPRTGAFLGGRDLLEEVREVSGYPVGTYSGGLLARPDGGVTLAFDTWEADTFAGPDPGLLSYDAALEPAGDPVRLPIGNARADLQAAALGPDGTVYLTVQPPNGDLLAAVRGGVVTDVLDIGGHGYDDAVVVDPAGWALLPARGGARTVDLATGAVGRLDVGCPSAEPVLDVLPGAGPSRALLLGRCDVRAPGTPMLWLVGA